MTRKDRTEGIYSRREVLDESERRQYCLIQLKDLLSYAYRYSEDVKKRFDRAQFNVEKFKTLSDIKHIPILKKKELIFLQSMGPRLGGLLTKDIGDLKRIFLSPGPIFDPEDRGEDYWGYTEAFYSVGFRPGDAVQNTFNYQLTPAGLMFEEPLRNLGCAVIPAGPTDASTQLDIMQKLRVSGYVGTPSFLMHLAQKAEEKGLNLRKDLFLEVAFVTGERLSEKMRSQMEKKYDLIMRQGYGTADVGCIGYECFHKTGLHIANRCYVEICHPDTGIPLKDGEVGEIVVTAFNKTYPLIRLATGDLSYIDRSPCACGRTSPRLGNIVGRVDTTARIMGMFVYPHQVEQVMSRFEEVKRWQIEVTNPGGIDEMTLFIETSGFKREEELLHQFREKIKLRPELKILAPGSLPPQIRPIEDKRHWINPVMEARPLRRAFLPCAGRCPAVPQGGSSWKCRRNWPVWWPGWKRCTPASCRPNRRPWPSWAIRPPIRPTCRRRPACWPRWRKKARPISKSCPNSSRTRPGTVCTVFRPAPATRCASAPSSICPPCSIPKTTSPASLTTCRSSSGACVTKASTIPCIRRTSGQFFPGAGGRPGPRAKVPPSPAPSFPQRALAGRMMIPAALRPSPDAGLPVEDFGKSAASPPPSLW